MTVKPVSAPFGTTTKRFLTIGCHPNLYFRPETYKFIKIGPGCYEVIKPRKIVSKVPRWKKELKAEEFSRNLLHHNDENIRQRKWLRSINGPGWQEIPSSSIVRGGTLSLTERFSDDKPKSQTVPGPGTYGKNHVPHTRIEEKSLSKGFTFSILPSFEQTSRAPRTLNIQLSYHLPPNLYKVKNSTDELLAKRVSKRGPYDLFTGERFPTSDDQKQPAKIQKVHTKKHSPKYFKGEFSRCGKDSQITSRLALIHYAWCKKFPSEPGPCHYTPYPTPVISQLKAPFNSSLSEVRPTVKCVVSPPPGRYQPQLRKKIAGNGMRSCFLSKVPRSFTQPTTYSWFE